MSLTALFGNIADSIRSKKGTSAPIVATDFPSEILSIPTGGGASPLNESLPVITWLYRDMVTGKDKIVKTNPVSGNAVPPTDVGDVQANADHNPALTFQGWNHTSTEMQNVQWDMCIGATYITTDGWSYFGLELNPATGLGPHVVEFRSTSGNTVTIDWMDGTPNHTFTGMGAQINKTWASYGKRLFRAKVTSGTGNLSISTGSASVCIYGNNVKKHNDALVSAFLGSNITLVAYSFAYSKIRTVSIPLNITAITSYLFLHCYDLEFLVMPINTASIGANVLDNNYSLMAVSMPKNTTTIGNTVFAYCYLLKYVSLSNFATIPGSVFNFCTSLKRIVIPSSITSLSNSTFGGCRSLTEIVSLPTVPPTIDATTFALQAAHKVYVPDGSLEAYKTATNWTAFENHIYPLSALTGGT